MAIDLPSLRALLISSILSFGFAKVQAQNGNSNPLVGVVLKVIGKGVVAGLNNGEPGYFVMATVTNRQDTAIKFLIMSCSWASRNWLTNNDSIAFHEPGCDTNIPIDIHLRPHQSIEFYGVLTPMGKKPPGQKVKLGFRYYSNERDLWPPYRQETKVAKPVIYWSNEVDVKDNLFKFQIE